MNKRNFCGKIYQIKFATLLSKLSYDVCKTKRYIFSRWALFQNCADVSLDLQKAFKGIFRCLEVFPKTCRFITCMASIDSDLSQENS